MRLGRRWFVCEGGVDCLIQSGFLIFSLLAIIYCQYGLFRVDVYMNEIQKITEAIKKFRDDRDWDQFHNPKDLAIALNIEAGELLEAYLWKESQEADPEKIKEELADILNYAFLLAEKYDFDIEEIILEKLKSNSEKYPVHKAKGSAKKYTDL